MKRKKKIALILISILFIVGLSSLVYTFLLAPEVEELDMYLTVGDYVGFNINTSAIYFGTVPLGGRSAKEIKIENEGYFPEKIEILASGELTEWIQIEENNFILSKDELKKIKVYAFVPKDAEYGNYTGELIIISEKKLF